MANRQIDPLELRRLVEDGVSYREIAQRFNVTVSGVQQAVDRIGLQRRTVSHKRFIPWTVSRAHSQSGPITSLRNLSKAVQGQDLPLVKLNSALRWAARLYSEHKDIDYDIEIGFFEKPATESWHIKMVLEEAHEALGLPAPAQTP